MIIGFAGRKRCGKTTLAKFLQEQENAVIITIANYLKYLCCDLMQITYDELIEKKDNNYTFDVVPDEQWFRIIDNHTNIGVNNIKKELENKHITNIRQLLQVIGTDVIRKFDEDWHVNQMINEIESYSKDKLIVIDDVRFPNEREAILKRSGRVFFIVRPNVSEVSNHSSETALKWQNFNTDDVILNNQTNLEIFKINFFIHYKNNFDCFIPKSIFLSENKNYLKCSNFGFEYDKDDELLSNMLCQIKDDELFLKYGIIRYATSSKELAERYIKEVDNSIIPHFQSRFNNFTTYNPLITENLKMYI